MTAAALWALGLAVIYVAPIRLVPTNDGNPFASATVWKKCLASLAATAACLVVTHLAGQFVGLQWLGLRVDAFGMLLPIALFITLFLGPLAQLHADLQRGAPFPAPANTAVALRAYLLAPVTEELTFRVCIGVVLLRGAFSPAVVIGASPLVFGAAHLPQIVTLLKMGVPWQQAVTSQAIQLMYTSVFGSLAMFVFLRTGCAAAAILLHAACNFIGCPNVTALASHPRRAYLIAMYLLGIASFTVLLWAQSSWPLLHPLVSQQD